MALRKISTASGFTLLETLIAAALLSGIAAFSLYAGLGDYRGSAARAEAGMIAELLQKARADALNNVDQLPHGLALFPADAPHAYVLFEGESYEASDPSTREAYPASYGLGVGAGSLREAVFSTLSGSGCCDGDIVLVDAARGIRYAISVNHEGLIGY
ncbi:MAG TPA: prepilin-type N-terminal cleavage/methylation domain-containing protein [Candidatus Paceibacterota bacterium]|nr:prepilin-type N-terminal cleavage/methylation domain-containing protein [Candidatus Paceibacterota bacterium]